jgi:hypothetical protein
MNCELFVEFLEHTVTGEFFWDRFPGEKGMKGLFFQ